jgi:hypothetical protein
VTGFARVILAGALLASASCDDGSPSDPTAPDRNGYSGEWERGDASGRGDLVLGLHRTKNHEHLDLIPPQRLLRSAYFFRPVARDRHAAPSRRGPVREPRIRLCLGSPGPAGLRQREWRVHIHGNSHRRDGVQRVFRLREWRLRLERRETVIRAPAAAIPAKSR